MKYVQIRIGKKYLEDKKEKMKCTNERTNED